MSDQTSIEYQYALLHMRRALQTYKRASAFLIAVVLPADADEFRWKEAARDALTELVNDDETDHDDFRDLRASRRTENSVDMFELQAAGKKIVQRLDPMAGLIYGDVRTIGLVRRNESEEFRSYPSTAILDDIIDIAAVDPALVQHAAKHVFGADITSEDATDIVSLPLKLRGAIRRTARPLTRTLERLRDARARAHPAAIKKSDGTPPLEGLHGYGDAKIWGLDLARDVEDYRAGRISWADVDNGLLLSGPPGTGKTTFAKALANTIDAHFVAGSYALWQSAGHQGDMLRAMRKAFEEAVDNAPSVLLIDEIDNFVQRGSAGDRHVDDYLRGVVNGLLEQMDGAGGREGVIVIGACNDPDRVDDALRRPGRLDRHIVIALPDAAARTEILRYHLQADIDIPDVVHSTEGLSGADLERVARDARRLARRAGMSVTGEHVAQSMPRMRQVPPAELRASAIHELGHAVVAIALGYRQLRRIVVHKMLPQGARAAAFAEFDNETMLRRDSRFLRCEVCVYLGSVAAEQLFYSGDHCDGVAHDLEQATQTASLMVAAAGMGRSLSSAGGLSPTAWEASRRRNAMISHDVEEILQQELIRAREIVEQYHNVIGRLSDMLVDTGTLDGSLVEAAVRQHGTSAQRTLASAQ